ncbi:hypothetical protein [Mycobacteroides abscessus]|uniref:hypothetical protein n=1 Tax=Mycobacteroides abscessus TaxID=36809 RepID=UPI0019D18796|nr:hypothetical protein [Mycobacteroides abscessus]MBN7314878.1 hypothetical protein [Mycobacteroides abscessus subsp. abscessus]
MSSNDNNSNSGDDAAGVLAAVVAVPMVGGAIWAARGNWYGVLAPYGMATEDTTTTRSGYGYGRGNDPWGRTTDWDGSGAETIYGTGHFHINPFGWAIIAATVFALVAALVLAGYAASWYWWRDCGGTKPIPKIPVQVAAYVAGLAAFWLVMLLIGRRESAFGHTVVALLALGAAAAAGWATWTYGAVPARRFRVVRAFEGLAAQVLGHTGNPIAGAVKAFGWTTAASSPNAREWPSTLTAVVGPGWSDTPTEHAGLNRAARQMGWPSYQWSYDPMRKRVVGTANPVSGHGPSVAKSVEG